MAISIQLRNRSTNEEQYPVNRLQEVLDPDSGRNLKEILSSDVEKIVWADLKALRDNADLKPGQLYRITDYETTTNGVRESAVPTPKLFDLIVLALSASELSEECWATYREGYSGLNSYNLSAWRVWYCLDNDKSRFEWAEADTKTTYNLDVYIPGHGMTYGWTRDSGSDSSLGGTYYCWRHANYNNPVWLNEEHPVGGGATVYSPMAGVVLEGARAIGRESTIQLGRGIIYRLIDEYENDCPYDFYNIAFRRYYCEAIGGSLNISGYYAAKTSNGYFPYGTKVTTTQYRYYYAFSNSLGQLMLSNTTHNQIFSRLDVRIQRLPNIVFQETATSGANITNSYDCTLLGGKCEIRNSHEVLNINSGNANVIVDSNRISVAYSGGIHIERSNSLLVSNSYLCNIYECSGSITFGYRLDAQFCYGLYLNEVEDSKFSTSNDVGIDIGRGVTMGPHCHYSGGEELTAVEFRPYNHGVYIDDQLGETTSGVLMPLTVTGREIFLYVDECFIEENIPRGAEDDWFDMWFGIPFFYQPRSLTAGIGEWIVIPTFYVGGEWHELPERIVSTESVKNGYATFEWTFDSADFGLGENMLSQLFRDEGDVIEAEFMIYCQDKSGNDYYPNGDYMYAAGTLLNPYHNASNE